MQNIFAIANAEDYWCSIQSYSLELSSLRVDAYIKSDPTNYLQFVFYPVEYFCGPIVWQGANFKLAGSDECLDVLSKLERHEKVSSEKLIGKFYDFKLYTVMTPKNVIRIVASNAQLLKK